MRTINSHLTIGAEVGKYKTEDGRSNYFQVSAKYAL